MVSQKHKRKIGEGLMLISFLAVVAPLLVFRVPRPVIGVLGFIGFLVGTELYLKNRTHWNDI